LLAKTLSFLELIVGGYFLKYTTSAPPPFAIAIPSAVSFILLSILSLISF